MKENFFPSHSPLKDSFVLQYILLTSSNFMESCNSSWLYESLEMIQKNLSEYDREYICLYHSTIIPSCMKVVHIFFDRL